MRSSLVAALLGLSLFAGCEVGDPIENNNGPDGGSQTPDAPGAATPRVTVSIDKPTVSTELMTRNMVTVTLASVDGFVGTVTLTASVVDDGGATLTEWPVTLSAPSVALSAGAIATSVATVTIPSENLGLNGTLRITATNTVGEQSVDQTVTSAFTVANQLTVPLSVVNNQCVYPAGMTTTRVKVGTKVRFLNSAADGLMRIHFDGGTGLDHAQVDTAVGAVYEDTPESVGTAPWYCHFPGNNPGNLSFNVVAP